MARRPPLACPQCASVQAAEDGFGVRNCDECGIEFRPRGRVPIRRGSATKDRFGGWGSMMLLAGVFVAVGVRVAIDSPPASPPPGVEPIVLQPYVPSPIFEPDFAFQGLTPPSVDVVAHRRELAGGRVVATGLLALPSSPVARPQVHVRFVGAGDVDLGTVMADVACSRLDTLPCPWGFSGLAPAEATELSIWASGGMDYGDFERTARLRIGFDDEFDPTSIDCNLPELCDLHARLVPHEGELEVAVGLPEGQRLRSPQATLVGYGEGSRVELVLPMPSPVGLARRVELPEHVRPIVRWQLWVEGPVQTW
ncbi:hypothetical protein ACNOYE_00740 [Nannocystaceae bacterium ST9]